MTSAQLLQDEAFARQAQFLADHGFGADNFLSASSSDISCPEAHAQCFHRPYLPSFRSSPACSS